MARLTQAIKNLTRLTSLSTRVLADAPFLATAFVQRPPSYTVPAFQNLGVAGYFGGGADAARLSGIDKITFPADTKTTLSATLSGQRDQLAGMANSLVAGYFAGGFDLGLGSATSGIDKITFPADTKTTLSATLTTATRKLAGMAHSAVAGYFGGGQTPLNRIDKITFPADTKTTLSATLSTARDRHAGMANSAVAGYFGGGFDTALISAIDKIAFPADTKTTLSATLTSARRSLAGMADSGLL